MIPARMRKAPRQPNADVRAAVSGAKMVDANPATRVRTVRGRTRARPYQRLITVKAGWYSTVACAVPATSQAAKNAGRFGASPTATRASTPSRDPPIISARGPVLSSLLPTAIPAAAETSRPAEKAPVTSAGSQPVSSLMGRTAAINE